MSLKLQVVMSVSNDFQLLLISEMWGKRRLCCLLNRTWVIYLFSAIALDVRATP